MIRTRPYSLGILLLTLLFVSGCSVYKHVPEDDHLFRGNQIQLPDTVPNRKAIRQSLNDLLRPTPNKRFLGIPMRLMVYNAISEPKKQKGLKYKMKYKYGQAPVLQSQTRIPASEQRIEDYLFSIGYFQANAKGKAVAKKKDGFNQYAVTPGPRFSIRSVNYPTDSSQLSRAILQQSAGSLIKPGQPFQLDVMKQERQRIDLQLKELGYYYFSPDEILFRLDTLTNHTLDVYLTIKPEAPLRSKQVWKVGDIKVFGRYNQLRDSSLRLQQGQKSSKYYVVDKRNTYKTELYDRVLLMKTGNTYNRTRHTLSIERLMNLNTFRYVRAEFSPDTSQQVNKLNVNFFLTPAKKQTMRFEVSGYSKSHGFVGTEVSLNYRNLNLMKGAEILDARISGGFDNQVGGSEIAGSSAYLFKTDLTLTIPKIVPPLPIRNLNNSYLARTVIIPGVEISRRKELYSLRSVKLTAGYNWKQGKYTEHNLGLLHINSIDPRNITPKFDSMMNEDATLKASFERQMVIGSIYRIQHGTMLEASRRFTYAVEGNLSLSGNLAALLAKSDVDTVGAKKIFNIPISQFVKFQAEFRSRYLLSSNTALAARIIAGAVIGYGNSAIAPYSEQFFIGGSSSIRAFRIRTLGPGSYHTSAQVLNANESGEIKVEMNAELRHKLTKFIGLGAFVDAGNIWLRKDAIDKPGSGLSRSDLFKEMAVGAGVGLRIDVQVMIIRFDIATPLRKPWYPEGSRWVFYEMNLGNKDWRKENIVLNIGFGYPF